VRGIGDKLAQAGVVAIALIEHEVEGVAELARFRALIPHYQTVAAIAGGNRFRSGGDPRDRAQTQTVYPKSCQSQHHRDRRSGDPERALQSVDGGIRFLQRYR